MSIAIHTFGSLARVPGLLHGVSGRQGGVSREPYDSLNLGLHVGDDPQCVLDNRRRLCDATGIDPARLVVAEQVHAGAVATVTVRDAGRGAFDHQTALPAADALATADRALPLMALSADCPLVVIVDPDGRVLGLVHASWRSTAAGIIGRTVSAMAALGGRPGRMLAAIGPCVGNCCYEVRNDFIHIAAHSAIVNADNYIDGRGGRTFFDLPAAVTGQLCEAGVPRRNVEASGICTACSTDRFYSHRAEAGTTGRFAAFAMFV